MKYYLIYKFNGRVHTANLVRIETTLEAAKFHMALLKAENESLTVTFELREFENA